MSGKTIKRLFWTYPHVILVETQDKLLIFEEKKFLSEAKKILIKHFQSEEEGDSHFAAFQFTLKSTEVLRTMADLVERSEEIIKQRIVTGHPELTENTDFIIEKNIVNEALHGVLIAFHDTSLISGSKIRFDAVAEPLSSDRNNLVIKFIFVQKQNPIFRSFKKFVEPNAKTEEEVLIQSKDINQILVNSNRMIIDLVNAKYKLQITPSGAQWI
ncbi:MAG: hypothetical protein O2900_17325 [Proteobacteria bacterium]|nr:hypothetical protein [Pseudomonadota bacterium]